MFRVSQHPSSGVLKTLTAASGTGHNIGPATSFQRGQVWTEFRGIASAVEPFPIRRTYSVESQSVLTGESRFLSYFSMSYGRSWLSSNKGLSSMSLIKTPHLPRNN